MKCQRLSTGAKPYDAWHRLWCAECRADHRADDLIACAISQMQAEPVPTEGLRQALETIEARGSQRRASAALPSRRRAPAAIRGILLAAQAIFVGTVLVMAIMGWRHRGGDLSLTGAAKPTSEIRTVHFVAEEFTTGAPRMREEWVKFPDKHRSELKGESITVTNGRRRLHIWTWCSPNRAEVRKLHGDERSVPSPPDWFTEAGLRRELKSSGGTVTELVRQYTERSPDGRPFLVLEVRTRYPEGHPQHDWPYYVKARVDPVSRLIVGGESWTERKGDGKKTSETRMDRVEYNTDLPDSLFSTAPPKGAIVHDLTTAAGVEAYYEEALRKLERLSPESRARLLDEWGRHGFSGDLVRNLWILDRLSPGKAPAIRERLKRYGISG